MAKLIGNRLMFRTIYGSVLSVHVDSVFKFLGDKSLFEHGQLQEASWILPQEESDSINEILFNGVEYE